ncbi:hypothetical protein B566_EDAN010376 [Ephemera danica]|nr:hypothetical protein B566_EDAN010376 [Ephemera danica]
MSLMVSSAHMVQTSMSAAPYTAQFAAQNGEAPGPPTAIKVEQAVGGAKDVVNAGAGGPTGDHGVSKSGNPVPMMITTPSSLVAIAPRTTTML